MRYTYKCYACMKTFRSDISYPRVDSGDRCPRCHTMITNAVNLVANAGPQYAPTDPFGNVRGARPRLERRNSAPGVLPGVPLRQPPMAPPMAPMMRAMVAPPPQAQPQLEQPLPEQAQYDNLYRLYDGYREWILDFIRRRYGRDLSEVHILIVPRDAGMLSQVCEVGGGGIYVKTADKMVKMPMWRMSIQQYEEEKQKQIPHIGRLDPGKCLLLLLKGVGDVAQQLNDCWIIWHEYGHALGESYREKYGLSEPAAWRFELLAVMEALESGALERLGFSKEDVRRFLVKRKPVYSSERAKSVEKLVLEVKELCEKLELMLA